MKLAVALIHGIGDQPDSMAESRRLGDEFLELVDGGRLGERLQALD